MGWNGMERNKLDYILTDLLPVELSENFSLKPFYDFLLKKENQKTINHIVENIKKVKASNNKKLFEGGWDTQPLKYPILKGANSFREMSLIQPLSAINLYIFIECYQKDILNYFEKEHCFSLRYHKKSNDLFYKGKTNKTISYFQQQSKRSGKSAIQQMGTYYKTIPFESLNAFTSSLKWRMSNFHYPYYAQLDYKSCFDSIYSHSYKWIIERNVIDSKEAKHSSLFITIDRILQNINGKSSNGLIVGPEFSRMIAEVLLQHIDKNVKIELSKIGILQNRDYVAYRYVDDIYIFAKTQETINCVISTFSEIAHNYLIQLNELKISKGQTPCLPKEWLAKTRLISDNLSSWFYTKQEYAKLPEDEKHIVKKDFVFIDRIKDDITVLMKTHDRDKRTIVSYLLSTIYNNISRKKDDVTLFGLQSHGRALMLLDMAFFIYSFCPTYEQSRKMISMMVYVNSELDFKGNNAVRKKIKTLLDRYKFIFLNGSLFDLIDWFVFLLEYKIPLDVKVEEVLIEKVKTHNDPILWGNLLLYAKYNSIFFNQIKNLVEEIINSEIERITTKNIMLNREFWYVLVFHNCPYISPSTKTNIENVIQNITPAPTASNHSDISIRMLCQFLKLADNQGKKQIDSFFNWNAEKGMGVRLTYRTYQRTVFKKYNKKSGFYTSLD